MKTLTRLLGLLVLGSIVSLSGCDDDSANTGKPGPSAQAPAAADLADEDTIGGEDDENEEDVYTYNPIGKRDPFRSFISGPREDDIRSPTPLQRWDIDQFLLVGIVWGVEQPKAMVEDPENQSHVLEIGTYIGRNWGKVTQVTADSVIITEEYQTIEGELVTEQVTLALPVEELQE